MQCCAPRNNSSPQKDIIAPSFAAVPPLSEASNNLIVVPPSMKATSEAVVETFTSPDKDTTLSGRMLEMLEAILEEQAGLRGIIQQLEEGLCRKLDDLNKSVASCNGSGQLQLSSLFQNVQVTDPISPVMSAREVEDLEMEVKKWFKRIDTDGNGSLSNDELKALLTSWSLSTKPLFKDRLNIKSPEDVDRMIQVADTNGDGEIDKDEFLAMVILRREETTNSQNQGKLEAQLPRKSVSSFFRSEGSTTLVERIVTSIYFESTMALVIIANLLTMSASLQVKGLHQGWKLGLRGDDANWEAHRGHFHFIDQIFNGVYLVELILRLWVHIHQSRIFAADIADSVVVVCCSLDVFVFQPMNVVFVNVSVLRLARLTRIARFFKVLRVSEHLSEMRVLIRTLCIALRGVMWSVVLLSSFISIGGVIMAQLANEFLEDDNIHLERRKWLYTRFGTTTASMYTMFEATFTGTWTTSSRVLIEEVHLSFAVFWILWVVLVNFLTIRVIGALFLHQTMQVSSVDMEKCAMVQLKLKGQLSENLRIIFQAADTSGDGSISQDEFDVMMSHKTVVEEFLRMGLDTDEVNQFFSVLVSDDGEADYNEFISGALAMATSAPQLNMMKSMQHDLNVDRWLQQILDAVLPLKQVLAPK